MCFSSPPPTARYVLGLILLSLCVAHAERFSARALPADVAAEAVGVNCHINYTNTAYYTQWSSIIRPRLVELGTRHIRDHFAIGNTTVQNRYVDLAHNCGIRLLLINNDGGTDLSGHCAEVRRLNLLDPRRPVVELIEPANERDNGWNRDWSRLCSYLQDYYHIYKADSVTRHIPLLGPSFANTRDSPPAFASACTGSAHYMDAGNLHAYSGRYPESPINGGWGISLDEAVARYRLVCGQPPVVVFDGESGYKMSGGVNGHPCVSQRAAAKYCPRYVLVRLARGIPRIYFYQLINDSEDFGLLNNDGTPRQQYIALRNFVKLMADPGPAFTPDSLSYTLEGDLRDIYQMLFQKRDGTFLLALWQGVNGSTGTNNYDTINIEYPDRQLTLMFYQPMAQVAFYRPSFDSPDDGGNGIQPVAIYTWVSTVSLLVPDHILLVAITPSLVQSRPVIFQPSTSGNTSAPQPHLWTIAGRILRKDVPVCQQVTVTVSGELNFLKSLFGVCSARER